MQSQRSPFGLLTLRPCPGSGRFELPMPYDSLRQARVLVLALLSFPMATSCSRSASESSDDDLAPKRARDGETPAEKPATTAASPSARVCPGMSVRRAKDARGAPLWSSVEQLRATGVKSAPAHVPVAQPGVASCRVGLGGKGHGVCFRAQNGEVGWLHHDGLLAESDMAGSLNAVLALPVCATETCDAATCQRL